MFPSIDILPFMNSDGFCVKKLGFVSRYWCVRPTLFLCVHRLPKTAPSSIGRALRSGGGRNITSSAQCQLAASQKGDTPIFNTASNSACMVCTSNGVHDAELFYNVIYSINQPPCCSGQTLRGLSSRAMSEHS